VFNCFIFINGNQHIQNKSPEGSKKIFIGVGTHKTSTVTVLCIAEEQKVFRPSETKARAQHVAVWERVYYFRS
jgi:hypothetical protein